MYVYIQLIILFIRKTEAKKRIIKTIHTHTHVQRKSKHSDEMKRKINKFKVVLQEDFN